MEALKRITSIVLDDFRLFQGHHEIDLDADVVLVFGDNGSGKSSLLYGLEYALTGVVSDLQIYARDYPRCLRHVNAKGSAKASVSYRDVAGEVGHAWCSVPMDPKGERACELIERAQAAHFVERCFLSQARLGRLVDLYQTVATETSETPLVTFIKRLLRVEPLDNMVAALHDIGDVRRIRTGFPGFAELEELHKRLPERQRQLGEDIKVAEEKQQARLTELATLLGAIGIDFDRDSWNGDTAAALRASLLTQFQTGKAEGKLLELERASNDLLTMKVQLAHDTGTGHGVDQLLGKAKAAESAASDASAQLTPALLSIVESLRRVFSSLSAPKVEASAIELWGLAGELLPRLRADHQRVVETVRLLAQEIAQAETDLKGRQEQLVQTLEELKALSANLPQTMDVLTEVLSRLEGNQCPVCLRDYGEVNGPSLKEFLEERISALGVQSEAIRNASLQKDAAQGAIEKIKDAISTLRRRMDACPTSVQLESQASVLADAAAELQRLEGKAQTLQSAVGVANDARAQMSLMGLKQQQHARAKARLTEIVQLTKSQVLLTGTQAGAVEELIAECNKLAEDERRRLSMVRQAIDVLEDIGRGFALRAELDKSWLTLNEQLSTCLTAKSGTDEVISFGRRMIKACQNAKRRLVERVFDEKLNKVWADLFERLVRNEKFVPRLGEPVGWRDQIRAEIQAVVEGFEPFSHIGSIHSLGNCNTAALSLFLSLNLIAAPRSQVLVLDDPVQSMDDVHITQLGILLRELVNQAQRQVLVAVHERAMFDFLAFELAPSTDGRRLITIELTRGHDSLSCKAAVQRHEWSRDRVIVPDGKIQKSA